MSQKIPYNNGIHVKYIVEQFECQVHKKEKGESCWLVFSDTKSKKMLSACGVRIKKAGFVGKISLTSKQLKHERLLNT